MGKKSIATLVVLIALSLSCYSLVPQLPLGTNIPDGQIAFTSDRSGNFEIYIMDSNGTNVRRLTNNTAEDLSPFTIPGENQVGFISDKDNFGKAMAIDLVNDNITDLGIGSNGRLSYSPDHTKFVYSGFVFADSGNLVQQDLFVSEVNNGEGERITKDLATDWFPDWSPDGEKIVFASDKDGDFEIYVMNSDGSDRKQITRNTFWDGRPVWSPDGQKIAFECQREEAGDWEICLINPDGSQETFVTQNGVGDWEPYWLPDGQHILYVSSRDGDNDLYIVDINGQNQIRLTNNTYDDRDPVWISK